MRSDDIQNPFGGAPIPATEEDAPGTGGHKKPNYIGLLKKVAEEKPEAPKAKQAAAALLGERDVDSDYNVPTAKQAKYREKGEKQGLPGRGHPGYDNKTGKRLPDGTFQKGFLKGVDKTIFLAMMADTLSSIGYNPVDQFGNPTGDKPTAFTRQAIERRDRMHEIENRRKELEAERQFRQEEAKKDRDARASEVAGNRSEKDLDRQHGVTLKQMEIDAYTKRMERNAEIENEAMELRAKYGAAAAEVEDLFRNSSEYDVTFPPGVNAETAMTDPLVRAQARQIIAPAKQARAISMLEQRNPKKAKELEAKLGQVRLHTEMWMQGMRPPTAMEMEQGIVEPQPTERNQMSERIKALVEGQSDEAIMHPNVGKDIDMQVKKLMAEYRLFNGGAVLALDDKETRDGQYADVQGKLEEMFHRELQIRQAYIRAAVPGATPYDPADSQFQDRGIGGVSGPIGFGDQTLRD